MNKKIGIQLDTDGDLLINAGGLVIGNTLYQNQYIILKAQKGEIKEFPLLGAGIEDMTNDDDILSWKKKIREELAKDGMKVSSLTIEDEQMIIKADY